MKIEKYFNYALKINSHKTIYKCLKIATNLRILNLEVRATPSNNSMYLFLYLRPRIMSVIVH
jgi:hypothetical protein